MFQKHNYVSRSRNGQQGFSLIELMVAVTIIGILTGLLLQPIGNYIHQTRMTRIAGEIVTIGQAWFAYELRSGNDMTDFVPSGTIVDTSVATVDITPGELELLLETPVPVNDAFGNPYIYRVDSLVDPERFMMISTTDGELDTDDYVVGTRLNVLEAGFDQVWIEGCPAVIIDPAVTLRFVPTLLRRQGGLRLEP